MIKAAIKKILSEKTRGELREKQNVLYWYLRGMKGSTPGSIKQKMLKKTGLNNKIKVLIETGTAGGGTVEKMSGYFDKIISIEVFEKLAKAAQEKFKDQKHITIIQGDSGEVFPSILPTINERILFWLDGHYSGDGTSKGALETPIIKELEEIFKHTIKNHIIMIDDARCFDGTNDYPTIEQLKNIVRKNLIGSEIKIKHDIIFIEQTNYAE